MGENAGKIVDTEGTVKWFDPKKGFGFIIGPDEQDIFVHYAVIDGEGFRVLKDGAKVRYDAHETEKGWHATRVQRAAEDLGDAGRKGHARTPRR